jgi:hypothetical protein
MRLSKLTSFRMVTGLFHLQPTAHSNWRKAPAEVVAQRKHGQVTGGSPGILVRTFTSMSDPPHVM